jgi:hypothetical protein
MNKDHEQSILQHHDNKNNNKTGNRRFARVAVLDLDSEGLSPDCEDCEGHQYGNSWTLV